MEYAEFIASKRKASTFEGIEPGQIQRELQLDPLAAGPLQVHRLGGAARGGEEHDEGIPLDGEPP